MNTEHTISSAARHTDGLDQSRTGFWNDNATTPEFPRMSRDLAVDVAIVGGGIVGVTAARVLKDHGLSVALVESQRIGRQATGKSTAKITSQHGLIYQQLVDKYDMDHARLYADAQQSGMALIRHLAQQHQIECNLETLPAYVFTQDATHVADLELEADIARQLGLPASLTKLPGLPFEVKAALRFDDQAQFHPVHYVAQLARTIPGDGSYVF